LDVWEVIKGETERGPYRSGEKGGDSFHARES
jgi:hypothetical protein